MAANIRKIITNKISFTLFMVCFLQKIIVSIIKRAPKSKEVSHTEKVFAYTWLKIKECYRRNHQNLLHTHE